MVQRKNKKAFTEKVIEGLKDNKVVVLLASFASVFAFVFGAFDWGVPKSVSIVNQPIVKIDEKSLDRIFDKMNSAVPKNKSLPLTKKPKPELSKLKKRSITLNNMDSKAIDNANASISVIFNNMMGQIFAKLTIAPLGKKPVSLPIYNSSQYIEFNSSSGKYIASVLSIDFASKNIVVDVSKLN